METLMIKKTRETPTVILNSKEGRFIFSGTSYPENINDFYSDSIKYLDSYIQCPKEKTVLEFNWNYFNTTTYKIIVNIIRCLKSVTAQNKLLEIKWYCLENDTLMIEKGIELKELLNVDFSIVYLSSNQLKAIDFLEIPSDIGRNKVLD